MVVEQHAFDRACWSCPGRRRWRRAGSISLGQRQQFERLATSQVLHFPVFQDPGTWDPGEMDAEVDTELMQNVFDNLWRFDDKLNIVPDVASVVPTSRQRRHLR